MLNSLDDQYEQDARDEEARDRAEVGARCPIVNLNDYPQATPEFIVTAEHITRYETEGCCGIEGSLPHVDLDILVPSARIDAMPVYCQALNRRCPKAVVEKQFCKFMQTLERRFADV